MDSYENWVSRTEAISAAFLTHFDQLFSCNGTILHEDIFFSLQDRVSVKMNIELLKPFMKEEIHASLFSMQLHKALGVNGLLAAFYQSFWDIIVESIFEACLHFLNDNESLGSLNHTLVAFVPKIKDPKNVVDYRLINLCRILYKIISKTLANKHRTFWPSLISMEQSAFVLGR